MTSIPGPRLSVIIPVRNNPDQLRACLAGLLAVDYPDREVLVVDDASTDETPDVAGALGTTVLRLPSRGGPALARNRGAAVAGGEFLLFLDSDVCVHADALRRVVAAFDDDAVEAVFGSYDSRPAAANFISQYRNLLHHFVHHQGNRRASTFWAGLGAVRRSTFLKLGGFDAGYGRPCIEDIELGVRLARAGRLVVLDPAIQGTHWKRWTLWGMIRTDVCDRGVPWTRLLLRQRAMPDDLNLKASQRASAVLALGLVGAAGLAACHCPVLCLLLAVVLLGILWLDARPGGTARPGLRHPAVLAVLASAGAAVGMARGWALPPLALLGGIVSLNLRFYAFLARERGLPFAVLAVPLHVLYYLYSTASFAAGVALHLGAAAARCLRKCRAARPIKAEASS
jgi:hypothetical protein